MCLHGMQLPGSSDVGDLPASTRVILLNMLEALFAYAQRSDASCVYLSLYADDLSTLAARQLLQTTSGSVYAVCPDKCDVNNGKCTFDSSNAGYKSIKCLNNMVVIKGRCGE